MMNMLKSRFNTYAQAVLDILVPANCHLCGRLLNAAPSYDDNLCGGCVSEMRRAPLLSCRLCGGELKTNNDLKTFCCSSCRRRRDAPENGLHRLKTCYLYEGRVRELIHQFKYGRRPYLGQTIASLMTKALAQDGDRFMERADILVPVPLHPCREREREFNQSKILAEALGKIFGIPTRELLRRTKNTRPQARLDPHERQDNLRNVFVVSSQESPKNKKIIIIDDIATTGATAREAASALADAGGSDIIVLAFAKG